jgi:hypothetical protein
MFFSKSKRIETITDDNIIITEIYKKSGRTFQLFCDSVKSKGTIGNNINFCLKMLTDSGFALIIDNKQMQIAEPNMADGKEAVLKQIQVGFDLFKEFADIL